MSQIPAKETPDASIIASCPVYGVDGELIEQFIFRSVPSEPAPPLLIEELDMSDLKSGDK